jgi:signal transduction histidine kinase
METSTQITLLTTLLPLIGVIFIIAVGVVILNQHFQKNLYRQKLEQEEIKNRHQQELLTSSILVQEQERKRIAQDIHDELGALLSISRMHLVQLEEKENQPGPTYFTGSLQNIRSLTEKALSSMRKISHELMPPQLETFGLLKTLEAVAGHANKTGNITICIDAVDHFPELPWPLTLGLYRIMMELINNTLKHAGADTINIELDYTNGIIACVYRQWKRYTIHKKEKWPGLKSIEGRASSLGGNIHIGNEGKGFGLLSLFRILNKHMIAVQACD